MATTQKKRRPGLVGALTDPLNWALLILALAFGYYVMMVPYWQNYYLKEAPQVLTLQEYMDNPTHPRAPMIRTLGAPPPSVEVIIEPLTIKHIDTDSITLTSDAGPFNSPSSGACDVPPMLGAEQEPPLHDIMVAGDNMDLLELSEGQQVSLQVFGLAETDLGWVPLEPTLDPDQEERFSKEELDALELMRVRSNGNEVELPYVETGELRLVSGVPGAGQQVTLAELAEDADYLATANDLQASGTLADIYGARLIARQQQNLNNFFIIEDDEGRRAQVNFNSRMLSEWRWALDRLEGQCVVVRGRLAVMAPPELRELEANGNIQAVVDGDAIMSPDGAVVISLENPAEALLGSGQ